MHGGNIYSVSKNNNVKLNKILDYSANMNDFIKINNIIIKSEYIKNYPEIKLDEYKKFLSNREFGIKNILIVPGLTYFIHKFISSLKNNIIIIYPSFTEYIYSKYDYNKIIINYDIIVKNPDIIKNYDFTAMFLVYPDNPTGNLINKDILFKLIDIAYNKNAYFFIDESFIYFVRNRKINENEIINNYNNVIIGRSLTKIFSIPGLRLGYIISDENNINSIEKYLEPWGISEITLKYIEKLDFNEIISTPEKTEIERNYMIKNLLKMNFELIGNPEANFITIKLKGNYNGYLLKNYLENKNIMIRLLDDYDLFNENYIRLNVKKHYKNKILIDNIKNFMVNKNE